MYASASLFHATKLSTNIDNNGRRSGFCPFRESVDLLVKLTFFAFYDSVGSCQYVCK